MQKIQSKNIDEYIAAFSPEIREKLEAMRTTIRKAAPRAEEAISYGIPTFRLNGNLVHFAAFKKHIGFYPGPSGIDAFRSELSAFEVSKGTVQFPLDSALPLSLVTKIVKFRVKENQENGKRKV